MNNRQNQQENDDNEHLAHRHVDAALTAVNSGCHFSVTARPWSGQTAPSLTTAGMTKNIIDDAVP